MNGRLSSPFESYKEMIVNGCRTAGISEAITNVQTITEKVENPLKEH